MKAVRTTLLLLALSSLVFGGLASAHPGHEDDGAADHNKHALHDFSHESETEGHIARNVNYGLRPVGHDTLGGVEEGRYTDVWADNRGFAYVGTFQEPTCDRSGVYISDIRDPANPTTVTMVKSPPSTRVNDVKTIEVRNKHFDGTVLIHTLEECGVALPSGQQGQGGIALYDVTDPLHPLKLNFLDFPVHNTYPWMDGENAYLIVVDNVALRDVVIVDITKPQSPKFITRVGLPDWPDAQDAQSAGMGNFQASFNHDVWVANVGSEASPDYRAVVSYWDAGFVTLNVNDPSNPTFVDDSTYPDPDPITGFSPPEGNAHAAVFDAVDAGQIFAGDEDFAPFRVVFEITEGPNAGQYGAAEGAFTTPIVELADQAMNGSSTYVGLACGDDIPDAVEDGNDLTDEIAVIQRGACRFDLKAQTAIDNGYDGVIVFNSTGNEGLVTMGGDPRDIPGVFVGHSTGLAIFNVESASELTIGQSGAATSSTAEFDGWGYFHLLDASLNETGYYAPGEVNDPDYAVGFGDLTMHNVEGDPTDADRAFIAWYSLGMRVVEVNTGHSVRPPDDDWDDATPPTTDYYGKNVTEVGRFIAEEGSNFWGVHVTEVDGQQYIVASDRNTGLWIFQRDTGYCQEAAGFPCPGEAQGGAKGKGKGGK